SDITGTEIMEESGGQRTFRFVEGPIFGNILLADEINRTPPRTQAALLEAMQEHKVTAAGHTMPLPEPFFVLATQNPIEQEGTYPLPEAQLDRFLFDIRIDYPAEQDEVAMLRATTGLDETPLRPVLDAAQIVALQRLVRAMPAAEPLLSYAARLVRATRPANAETPALARRAVRWGAGPRAGQALILGAKAHALLAGRTVTTPDDVRRVAMAVLRHRVLVNFAAEAEGITPEHVIDDVLTHVSPPSGAIGLLSPCSMSCRASLGLHAGPPAAPRPGSTARACVVLPLSSPSIGSTVRVTICAASTGSCLRARRRPFFDWPMIVPCWARCSWWTARPPWRFPKAIAANGNTPGRWRWVWRRAPATAGIPWGSWRAVGSSRCGHGAGS
ncbi:MAG: MoxR family ATPase, partial [Gemmatimonadales bacterium]